MAIIARKRTTQPGLNGLLHNDAVTSQIVDELLLATTTQFDVESIRVSNGRSKFGRHSVSTLNFDLIASTLNSDGDTTGTASERSSGHTITSHR